MMLTLVFLNKKGISSGNMLYLLISPLFKDTLVELTKVSENQMFKYNYDGCSIKRLKTDLNSDFFHKGLPQCRIFICGCRKTYLHLSCWTEFL